MKKAKSVISICLLACTAFFCVACGNIPETTITLGQYNAGSQTFTPTTTSSQYSLTVNGNTLTLKGTIPYSSGVLGIQDGNIIAIKFKPTQELTPDESTSIKTTNKQSTDGWNTYDKSALETDGSLIWVTSVNKTNNVQIKIKWNKDFDEATYTLIVDSSATLSTAS